VPVTAPLPLAVVMTSFEPGGTERQMIELIRRLDPARWTVHVACFRRHGAWFGRVAQAPRRGRFFGDRRENAERKTQSANERQKTEADSWPALVLVFICALRFALCVFSPARPA